MDRIAFSMSTQRMDDARLITLVREYEELYNAQHPLYCNQQRRDGIWEGIGKRMGKPGLTCKERWTRLRDNHRKALNLRQSKGGPEASKMKPPKFARELGFLIPHLYNDQPLPVATDNEEEEEEEEVKYSTHLISPPRSDEQSPCELEQYPATTQPDPLLEFFCNMARTVQTFPVTDQVQIKAKLFQIVNAVELRLASEMTIP